jgi:hypothetical protein
MGRWNAAHDDVRLGAKRVREDRLDFEERRGADRSPRDEAVSILVLHAPFVPVEGRVLDESTSGMKLTMPRVLEPGTLLQIRSQNRFVLAEVRHCSLHDDGCHIGVEIKDIFDLSGPR